MACNFFPMCPGKNSTIPSRSRPDPGSSVSDHNEEFQNHQTVPNSKFRAQYEAREKFVLQKSRNFVDAQTVLIKSLNNFEIEL